MGLTEDSHLGEKLEKNIKLSGTMDSMLDFYTLGEVM